MKTIIPLIFCCLCVLSANATRFYVKSSAFGSNTGVSWTNATTKLEDALVLAIAGDEIWVAAGTYKPAMNTRTYTYAIPVGVKVYGGFLGTETALSQRNWSTNLTTLSGDIGTIGTTSDNTYHIVRFTGGGSDTRLDGFRIINGNANGTNLTNNATGGAIYIETGNPTIANCKMVSNSAIGGGGAVYVGVGNPTFLNCNISSNTASVGGGVAAEAGCSMKFFDCTLNSNIASGKGGAIYSDGVLTINKTIFSGNSSIDEGAAIYAKSGTPTLYNSLIVGNSGSYGVIYAYGSSPTIINCTIANNQVVSLISNSSSSSNIPTMVNSIVWNNTNNNTGNTYFTNNCILQGTYTSAANKVINTNPKFVSLGDPSLAPFTADNYDYHLQATSPAVDYGSSASINATYALDLESNPRTQGNAPDLGCYEFNFVSTENTENDTPIAIAYANGCLFIEKNEALLGQKINIYGVNGVLLQTKTIDSDVIPLSELANGAYIARLQNQSLKFVVAK